MAEAARHRTKRIHTLIFSVCGDQHSHYSCCKQKCVCSRGGSKLDYCNDKITEKNLKKTRNRNEQKPPCEPPQLFFSPAVLCASSGLSDLRSSLHPLPSHLRPKQGPCVGVTERDNAWSPPHPHLPLSLISSPSEERNCFRQTSRKPSAASFPAGSSALADTSQTITSIGNQEIAVERLQYPDACRRSAGG